MKNKTRILIAKIVIHLAALIPLVYSYYVAIFGLNIPDPVEYIIHFTGLSAMKLLLITLFVSPAAKHFKQSWLMQVRRLLGIYCFSYALFHVGSFWLFELNLNLSLFINELIERPYIWLGMAVFIILFALAITSLNSIKRSMGKNWQTLHNLIYLALILGWGHYYWSVKGTPLDPILYLVIALFALSFRWPKVKKLLTK